MSHPAVECGPGKAENGLIQPSDRGQVTAEKHRQELLEFVDSKDRTGIFVAETSKGAYAGLIWVSKSDNRELWDFKTLPAWVYDIRVEEPFRRHGLGARLLDQGEQWARIQGFSRIGLHVFGRNENAVRLYTRAEYVAKNLYLQKELKGPAAATEMSTPFRIRASRTRQDIEHIIDLGYQTFKVTASIGGAVPERKLRERYEAFIQRRDYEKANHRIHVAEGSDGAFAGFVWTYLSQGDLGSRKYVWMQDIAVSPTFRGRGLGRCLLNRAELWAMERGLDAIRTGARGSSSAAMDLLRSAGYTETNLFLEKRLP